MSSDEYSNQYKILEKILNGTIELYNKYELENILKNGKRWPKDRKIIDFIIAQNKIGNASRRTDIIDNLLIGRSTLDVYTRHLREKKIIASPTALEFARLTKKIKGTKYDFNNCPKNVKNFLEKLKGKHGTSYRKRLKIKYLKNRRFGVFYLALVYDENGPVYRNCFPESELNFEKKINID